MANRGLRLGVSACLLGQRVRYDGGHKACPWLLRLAAALPELELVPVCPEVEAGLGIPRPPVALVATPGGVRVLGLEDPSLEATEALQAHAARRLAELPPLHGFVLKARSPSCGLDTPVRGSGGEIIATSPGIFAAALRATFPTLPVEEAEALEEPARRRAFLEAALVSRRRLREGGAWEEGRSWERRLLALACSP